MSVKPPCLAITSYSSRVPIEVRRPSRLVGSSTLRTFHPLAPGAASHLHDLPSARALPGEYPDQSPFDDGCLTHELQALGKQIRDHNSPNMVQELVGSGCNEVDCLIGRQSSVSRSSIGPLAEAALDWMGLDGTFSGRRYPSARRTASARPTRRKSAQGIHGPRGQAVREMQRS